jgi:hypothetical protein
MKKHAIAEKAVMILLFVFAVIVPVSFIIMVIWNDILTEVFRDGTINRIDFWQALGLLALAKIFFGGLPSGWWAKKKKINESEEHAVLRKLQRMTSEEKDQFREQWRWQFDSSAGRNDPGC